METNKNHLTAEQALQEIKEKVDHNAILYHSRQTLIIVLEIICYVLVVIFIVIAVLLSQRMMVGATILDPEQARSLDENLLVSRVMLFIISVFHLGLGLLLRRVRVKNRMLHDIKLIVGNYFNR